MREAAIAALIQEPTIEAAAKRACVAEVTLWRWMQEEDFQAAYLEARRRLVEAAIGHLQSATGEAVEALRRNLGSGAPATEVRAATAILEMSVKAVELTELEGRLERLERLVERREEARRGIG